MYVAPLTPQQWRENSQAAAARAVLDVVGWLVFVSVFVFVFVFVFGFGFGFGFGLVWLFVCLF